jgi:hypothetical protein
MTNFERIKGMSVEELAEMLLEFDYEYSVYIVMGQWYNEWEKEDAIKAQIEWLESEVEE